jgi:hypothetical protein
MQRVCFVGRSFENDILRPAKNVYKDCSVGQSFENDILGPGRQ